MENSSKGAHHLSVLVVEDKPDLRKMLCDFVEAEGHSVIAAGKLNVALGEVGRSYFDLALIGLRPGTQSGMDLTLFRAKSPWIKLVVYTAQASTEGVIEAMDYGAFDYLTKPFTRDRVAHLIRRVAEIRTVEQKLSALKQIYDESVPEVMLESSNAAMQRVLTMARQVADSEAAILIRGESGAGKSFLARQIHSWSGRSPEPFATISCPYLPAELLENELFGLAKGSFAGAMPDDPGRISACQGGTLLLDEIGELPLSVQPKLLRFLLEKTYERVGDPVARKANVRMIATTNADLEASVRDGKLREDLFYRLNLVEIIVPPLRERQEDILPLAEGFAVFFAKQNHSRAAGFSIEAGEILKKHNWPNNVRELRNTVERAVLLCKGPQIGLHDLFSNPGLSEKLPLPGDPVPLEKIEELHIRRVLASAKSIEEASRILKVDLVTLWRKRKKYGV
ncbi:MAG: sigma-54 dependent transcriptional regulator [Syntrophobacteraceae bacterium]|nr:sigma-54 dependent transcriptional regulator [Syntrophobacteraceae bacterium]